MKNAALFASAIFAIYSLLVPTQALASCALSTTHRGNFKVVNVKPAAYQCELNGKPQGKPISTNFCQLTLQDQTGNKNEYTVVAEQSYCDLKSGTQRSFEISSTCCSLEVSRECGPSGVPSFVANLKSKTFLACVLGAEWYAEQEVTLPKSE